MTWISSHPLNIANHKLKKDLERLSSAYRINRAGDGAAELAVSQSMRADIIEMKTMKKNAKDGISLVQTAEGALAEVHDMLNRMIELSDQAANGTYEDSDRANLQSEVEQLKTELDRIAASTNYNGIKLLNGDLAAPPEVEPPPPPYSTEDNIAGTAAKAAVQTGATWEGTFDASQLRDGTTLTINGVVFEFDNDNFLNTAGAVQVTNGAGGLAAAILGSSLGSALQGCTVTNLGGDTYQLELEQNAASAEDGKDFQVKFGNSIPEATYGTPEIKPVGSSKMLLIGDIDLDTLVDGTVLEIFGKKYELDFDGTYSASPDMTRLDLTNMGNTKKYVALQNALKAQGDIASKVKTLAIGQDGGAYKIQIRYKDTVTPSTSDIRFNSVPNTPPPPAEDISSQKGVNKPAVLPQSAYRTDVIDFSRFQEGDSITINGHVFELDSDGVTAGAGNIPVNIRGITKPSEIVNALKAAFDAQGFPDMTLTAGTLGDDKGSITVTSSSAVEGERMCVEYQNAPPPEEPEVVTGLYLQVGPDQSGGLRFNLDGMNTEDLGIVNVSVGTAADAERSILLLKRAVDKVSGNRGTLGAVHNRLEHTYNNLSVAHENLTAAEDRITSADIGEEMAAFTKDQIVAQAAQSMLAQSKDLATSQVQQLLQF